MPNNIKAGVSVAAMLVAIAWAYWEASHGRPDLFWFVIATGIFMVVAMWIFPEAAEREKVPGKRQ